MAQVLEKEPTKDEATTTTTAQSSPTEPTKKKKGGRVRWSMATPAWFPATPEEAESAVAQLMDDPLLPSTTDSGAIPPSSTVRSTPLANGAGVAEGDAGAAGRISASAGDAPTMPLSPSQQEPAGEQCTPQDHTPGPTAITSTPVTEPISANHERKEQHREEEDMTSEETKPEDTQPRKKETVLLSELFGHEEDIDIMTDPILPEPTPLPVTPDPAEEQEGRRRSSRKTNCVRRLVDELVDDMVDAYPGSAIGEDVNSRGGPTERSSRRRKGRPASAEGGMIWAPKFAYNDAGLEEAKKLVRRGIPVVLCGFPQISFRPSAPPNPYGSHLPPLPVLS